MSEFEPSDYTQYDSVNDWFVRPLKNGTRPIASLDDESVLVSPADARVNAFAVVPKDWQFLIKEEYFTISELVDDDALGTRLADGSMMVVRLAPQDYHQYHAPMSGTIASDNNVEGPLYSVNADAILSENAVLLNQRRVTLIEHPTYGEVVFVAVGATCVGSIVSPIVEGQTTTKGDHFGQFEFGGSTVVMLFPPNSIEFDADLIHNTNLRMETRVAIGTKIGRFL